MDEKEKEKLEKYKDLRKKVARQGSVYATGITDWVGGLGMATETLQGSILSFAVDNNRCFLFPCFLI